jgi:hypothetical protein
MLSDLLKIGLPFYLLSSLLSALAAKRTPEDWRHLLPGLIFGIMHGLMHFGSVGKILTYAALCAAAFYTAVLVAISVEGKASKSKLVEGVNSNLLVGLIAGAWGSLCVSIVVGLLTANQLGIGDYARTVFIGGISGAAFLVILNSGSTRYSTLFADFLVPFAAFFLWQWTVGVSIDSSYFSSGAYMVEPESMKVTAGRFGELMFVLIPVFLISCPVFSVGERRMHADSGSTYRDLLADLTRHSWIILTYALASVVLIYALGFWPSVSLLFFVFLVPTIAAVSYVLSANPILQMRLLMIWSITTLIAWAYKNALMVSDVSWASDALSLGLILVVIYWLSLAISSSKEEFVANQRRENTTSALAWLLSTWGATLQVAFVSLLVVKYLLHGVLATSTLGSGLVHVLEAIRLTSPVMWLPSGVFAAGMIFYAVVLFTYLPYVAPDFKDILPAKFPPVVNDLFAAVRIPVWLVVVIIGFLVHFVSLLGYAFGEFGEKWLGRFTLLITALIAPTLSLLLGNLAFLHAMSFVSANLMGQGDIGLWASLLMVLIVHGLVLSALFLYVISVAPMGCDVVSVSIRTVPGHLKRYFAEHGFSAAQAAGKSFALYGIVFLAVPLASLLPGGAHWGVFSTCYTAIIAIAAILYVLKEPFARLRRAREGQ